MPSDPGLVLSSLQAPVFASVSEQLQGPFHSPRNNHSGGGEGVTRTVTASKISCPAANPRERAGDLQGPDAGWISGISQKKLGPNVIHFNGLSTSSPGVRLLCLPLEALPVPLPNLSSYLLLSYLLWLGDQVISLCFT